MIQSIISITGKSYNPKDEYRYFYKETLTFADKDEANKALAKRYGKSWKHRDKMFVDTKSGEALHCGYTVGFHNADWSHAPVEKWLQRDWIEFREVNVVSPV